MLWIKILLFCITGVSVLFLTGNYVCNRLNFRKYMAKSLTTGFIIILSVFQLIAYLISIGNGSLLLLVCLFVAAVAAIMLFAIRDLIRKRREDSAVRAISKKRGWKNYILVAVIVFLIGIQTFLSAYLHHTDADDAYFITISTTTVEAGELISDAQFVSTGLVNELVDTRPNTSTWEYFIAVLSVMFDIPPAILAHTVLPILLIPLSYLAVYSVAVNLAAPKARLYFMLVFVLLNFLGGYSVYSTACFLLLRIWQGKAVLVSVIFPSLFSSCLELMKTEKKRNYWIYNALILIAGVCTSVIGVYLTPIYYVLIGVPYMLHGGIKRIRAMLAPAALSLVPCGIFAAVSLFQVLKTNSEYMEAAAPVWSEVLKNNWGAGYYYVFFAAACIYTMFKGNEVQKAVICGSTVFAFATFLNPLLCNVVAQKITGVDVYWRLYWTLPFYYAIAFFLSAVMAGIRKVLRPAYIVMLIILLNYMGDFMYQPIYYSEHENAYKIPGAVIHIVDYILENSGPEEHPNILLPENLASSARQYDAGVTTAFSRMLYQGNRIVPGTDMNIGSFYYPLYSGELTDGKYIAEMLDRLGVEWLALPYQLDGGQESADLVFVIEIDGYYIYEAKGRP